jgi:hypothetical protein
MSGCEPIHIELFTIGRPFSLMMGAIPRGQTFLRLRLRLIVMSGFGAREGDLAS